MELVVAQPRVGDPLQGGHGDGAAEGRRGAEADVVGHDQQDVGRALGGRDLCGEVQRRLGGAQSDRPPESQATETWSPEKHGARSRPDEQVDAPEAPVRPRWPMEELPPLANDGVT